MNTHPTDLLLLRKFTGLRHHLGHLQADWGHDIGRNEVGISRIVNGESPLLARYLVLIAEKHGFPVEHFFWFNPDTRYVEVPARPEQEQLRRENESLRKQLAHAEELVERMKKELAGRGDRRNAQLSTSRRAA